MSSVVGATPRGLLFLVTAPSGAGKDSVLRALRGRDVDIAWVVTAVTRDPRVGDVNGREHFFISPDEFDRRRRDGWFLETASVYGRRYGTPIDQVREPLARGEDVILRLDVQGARELKRRYPAAIVLFVEPPTPEEAERRLRERATESDEEIARRIGAMHDYELAFAAEADYRIPSPTGALEEAADGIWAIVVAERLRPAPRTIDPASLVPATDTARQL